MSADSKSDLRFILEVGLSYLLFSTLWIVSSDWIVETLVADQELQHATQSIKGLVFVILTTSLIIALMFRGLRARHQADARLDRVLENIPDAVLVSDLEGKVVLANPAVHQVLGLSPAKIVGSRLDELWPDVNASQIIALLRSSTPEDPVGSIRLNTDPVEASATPIRLTSIAITDEGQIVERIFIATDLREELAALEAKQRHTDELEERVRERTLELETAVKRAEAADKVKSYFLATMSHELRNPLNAIIGFTSVLLKQTSGALNAAQHKQLLLVRDSGQHLLALINDVLDISRIEADQLTLSAEPFDLVASIRKVLAFFEGRFEDRGVELRLELATSSLELVSDARRFEQIVINLVANALEHASARSVEVRVRVGDGWVFTDVEDSGVGIDGEMLDIIFEPFKQAHRPKPGGTGLGLAISRRLAAMMKGNLSVESEVGRGSCFTISIPLNTARRVQ